MKNILKTLSISTLLLTSSSQTIAGSGCDYSNVDETSADAFVRAYYSRLAGGMSREQQSFYLSGEQNYLISTTIAQLAIDGGHELEIEAQRFMDSKGVEASCESLNLRESKVSGVFGKFGWLTYDIEPTCVDWKNTKSRSLTLRYSEPRCSWIIKNVSEEVQYQ